ncbi:hypothetical protein ATI61_106340 [Archangium gephyra]|uniref:Lipoprotein n=2 Tax=Archangium gephyra TaxID=48 RepID=A0AAC8Q143_9BACT|nr:Hypothetical protein AA314_00587 [Archangium gephyra]REG30870.1 hypothetical protein ATI61_106340 [Archangium gephyra]
MMGRKLMETLLVLPMAVLAACGGDVAGTEQAVELGEKAQGVLYAPPPVSSGNSSGKQFPQQTACAGGACTSLTLPPAPAGYALTLSEQAITSQLQATLDTGEDAYEYTTGSLRRFDFAWPYAGEPTLAQADAAVLGIQDYDYSYGGTPGTAITYAQLHGYLYSEFQPLHPQILSTYANGVENVQVMTHYFTRLVAPGASGWFRLNVILFPQSKKILVFEQQAYET